MTKGPKINYIEKNFTTRDSLGIEGVATSIQGEICPIVNTVTPRAFYWPFLVWIYYDFYKYSGIVDYTIDEFDKYLKRQDYFFVLATLLTKGSDQTNLVGKQQSQIDIANNPSGPYSFNPAYFKTKYGGMQYYNAGCLSMHFITLEDPENNKKFSLPKLRPEGEKIAQSFETIIKNTEYYKLYRRNDKAVPRKVLEEYGKVIKFNLNGFDECKAQLRHYLFDDDTAIQFKRRSELLTDCAKYLSLIIKDNNVEDLSVSVCRCLFYDKKLLNGKKLIIPEECISVANKWEIVIGRMYFTTGVEMLWKYMLEQLHDSLTLKNWISNVIKVSDFNWDLRQNLDSVIEECVYDFKTREDMVYSTARKNTSSYSVENGIRLILSVYNHFKDRKDFADERAYFSYGVDTQSISLNEMFERIDSYKERSIQDFIVYVMQNWIVEQHYCTAYDKMLQGRDGFYFEIIDKRYIKKYDFSLEFQGIRMVQLAQVMKDLDML